MQQTFKPLLNFFDVSFWKHGRDQMCAFNLIVAVIWSMIVDSIDFIGTFSGVSM